MPRCVPWSLVTVLALAFGASPALAAEKRAFALPDLYRLQSVEEPAVSPDGRSIAYKVTTSDLAAVKRQANLWRVDPDGANAQALTFADKTDSAPRFSPDGKTLYFLSTRNGDPQVFTMSGGEPRPKTDFPGGVGAFTLSGNGHALAVSADVWATAGPTPPATRRRTKRAASRSSRPTWPIVSCSGIGPSGATRSAPTSSSSIWRSRMPRRAT